MASSVNPLQLTFYKFTGYSFNDEPASEAAIALNESITMSVEIKEYEPMKLSQIKVNLTDEQIEPCDFLKITDTVTSERWYFYILNNVRINEKVVLIYVRLDAFATVGLSNISFFGNLSRRSLSAAEAANYPRLPEPWAPRRPLKTRRMIVDLNTGKTVKIPAHIATTFEEDVTQISDTETINVPNTPLGITTFQDSLSISANIPIGYPNAAASTTHNVNTPWGNFSFDTPYESYYTMNASELGTFLAKAKKYNALDLIEAPYYLPSPNSSATVNITEFNAPTIVNKKAYKYYTTMTVRSLASNQSRTYDDQNADLQPQQPLAVIVVPDKNGGIYVIPSTIRDTGLNEYTYLDGVFSPFESVLLNAIGDTPAKFAADGTNILNTALNNLFQTYINKINAIQYEGMQAKYFKDLGAFKSVAMAFLNEVLGYTSTTRSDTDDYWQNSTINTYMPATGQLQDLTQNTSSYTQTQNSTTSIPQYNTTTNLQVPSYTTWSNLQIPQHNTAQNITETIHSNTETYVRGNITTPLHWENTSINTPSYWQNSTTHNPAISQTTNTSTNIPNVSTTIHGWVNTAAHWQNSTQNVKITAFNQTSNTTVHGNSRSIANGVTIAEAGVPDVYDQIDQWSTLKTIIFGGYRNEVHSFMLGNINDYLNRWVAIQNDLHNGNVANLFKNVTLVGTYQDYNKFAGKFEVLITSLQPEDEANFDLFLSHFGHAVDEYTTSLVTDVGGNFAYTMVGDDAILTNTVSPELSGQILNQFRTGVRVWKTLVRPSNY